MIIRAAIVIGIVLSAAPVAAQETQNPQLREVERLKSRLRSCSTEHNRSLRYSGNPGYVRSIQKEQEDRKLVRCRSQAHRAFDKWRQGAAQSPR